MTEKNLNQEYPKEKVFLKYNYLKYGLFTLGILSLPASYYLWATKYSPNAKLSSALYENNKIFEGVKDKFKSDTYGGKTPEETIQLLIKALETNDLELAAKYFKRKINGEEDERVIDSLNKLSIDGGIDNLISDIKQSRLNGQIESASAVYDVFDGNQLKYQFLLKLSPSSNLWKIESL